MTVVTALITACNNHPGNPAESLNKIMDHYWDEHCRLFPVDATANGDNRYNNLLTITISESFRDTLKQFYTHYLAELKDIDTTKLNNDDLLSYRLLRYQLGMDLEGLKFPSHLLPINQFWSFTLDLPQLGSGTGNQPFKTYTDYTNWLERLSRFPAWTDTAIANMRKGRENGWILPSPLVDKIIPQLTGVLTDNDTTSVFYNPIRHFPESITGSQRIELATRYQTAIHNIVTPSYAKLFHFFQDEYRPKARATSGLSAIPGGADYYSYLVRYWTTTSLTPDSIYQLGLAEVARLESEMNKVKEQVGFQGKLVAFYKYLDTDPRFCPFKQPQDVIDSFWHIKKREEPLLSKLFADTPKTAFTIRQTEAYRAASASAEYNPGSADGARPGIFFVPVLDATKYNAVEMTTLFLHEAIPGHHFQISLQQENKSLPRFRRFLWYGAYGEGWAHYCETLGNEMGLYNDPYQYFGHLSDGILRAIRLVVDVGLHTKNMTRIEAIQYMMTHQLISEHDATAEVERYMAIPGQALSYKVGQITILREREKYKQLMGDKFNYASFHKEVLKDGCVPLDVLSSKLEAWSKR